MFCSLFVVSCLFARALRHVQWTSGIIFVASAQFVSSHSMLLTSWTASMQRCLPCVFDSGFDTVFWRTTFPPRFKLLLAVSHICFNTTLVCQICGLYRSLSKVLSASAVVKMKLVGNTLDCCYNAEPLPTLLRWGAHYTEMSNKQHGFLWCNNSHGFYQRNQFLPARRYASAGYRDRNVSVRLFVCPCVRPSRAGIVSKRRKLAAWFLHHLVAPRL